MGKVISTKIQGMSWVMKTSLVLLLTLATTVFMYEGWYKPQQASAATVTYGVTVPNVTTTGIDGLAQFPTAAASVTTAPTVRGNMSTTLTTSGASYRPTTGMTNGTPTTLLKLYSPAYATAQTITAPSGSFAIRGYNASDTWTFHVYSHNPSGAAGNKTLMYSSNTTTSGTGATVVVVPTYTLVNNAMPAGYKLLIEVVYTPGGTTYTPRIYVDGTANTTWCRLTVTETPVITDSTAPTAGTVTVSPDISSTYTSSSPTITTVFTDSESSVSSCQYTTDGTAWVAGAVSGAGPYTCTATPTGRTGFLNINMRATSLGGTGTATQIQRTVDSAPPTDGLLTVTQGDASNSLSWTAAYDAGFGVNHYDLVFATGSTAPATCAAGTPVTGSPFSSATLSTVHSGLTNGTVYSYRLCATDNNSLSSAGVTGSGTPFSDPTKVVSCTACHFKSGIADGTNRNTPTGYFQGSHGPHAAGTNNYACSVCHTVPGATEYDHTNRLIAMQSSINGGTYNKTNPSAPSNIFAPSTCNNTTCHGTQSPQWGTTPSGTTCNKCHSDTTITTTFRTTAQTTNTPKSIIHISHLTGTHGMSSATGIICADCHTIPATANDAGHNDTALPADVPMNGVNASKNAARSFTPGTETCANVYCHGTKTPTWTATFLNSTISDCNKCHDLPPTPGTGSHAVIPSAITTIAGLSACSSRSPSTGCHPTINGGTISTYAGIFFDKTQHIDGTVQGGSCVGCHSAALPAGSPKRIAAAGQFSMQSHHVQGVTTDGTHCAKCHWEANSDGSVNSTYHDQVSGKPVDLVIWTGTSRPAGTSYVEGAGGTAYTANGTRAQVLKINNHCLGCHNATNAETNAFADGRVPTQYSPEPKMSPALAKTSILSRYSSTRTVPWSNYAFTNSSGNTVQYGTNQKKLVTKAISAHGNAIKNKFPNWAATTNGTGEDETMADIAPATLGANRNVLCYDCHNSHGSDAAGITSSYSSATGRYKGGLLKSTVAGLGGYATTYKPAARTINYKNYSSITTGAALFNTGASICNDCHNNDTRKVNISKPWSITATYSSTKAIVGYWSTPYFDNYTFASAKRTIYKQGGAIGTIKDLRKPMGGHYGSSVNGTSAGHSGEINGLCTPCHDPHGVSSSMSAVNRGKSVPLLKGTWVTSPYREDKATPTVYRGGGRNFPAQAAMGAMPGYNIDQNTLVNQPALTAGGGSNLVTAEGALRKQQFTVFPGAAGAALAMHTEKTPADFAGLCIGCHAQATLTNATAPAAGNWMSKERVHQSVAGWAATTGTNANGTVHAYTCSKCHAPHVSRLPRLMITNCLDVRHTKRAVSGGSVTATTPAATPGFAYGNVLQSYAVSGKGAGRFPAGGARYNGTPASAQNNGPWYFVTAVPTAFTANSVANYGSNCHNATAAGGATYDPTKQLWNKKTRW